MDWARWALDLVDTLIWPVAVVGLVVFFVFRFRVNIARLIERIQGGKAPGGFEFTASPPGPGGQSPSDPSVGGVDADALAGAMDNLTARLSDTVASLARTEVGREQLKNDYEALRVFYQFERIYRMIHGTQLLFLLALRAAPERTASEEQFSPFFDEHVRRTAAEANYTADKDAFGAFLINSEMMEFDSQARSYKLTDWGAVFLDYVANQGLSRIKAY